MLPSRAKSHEHPVRQPRYPGRGQRLLPGSAAVHDFRPVIRALSRQLYLRREGRPIAPGIGLQHVQVSKMNRTNCFTSKLTVSEYSQIYFHINRDLSKLGIISKCYAFPLTFQTSDNPRLAQLPSHEEGPGHGPQV